MPDNDKYAIKTLEELLPHVDPQDSIGKPMVFDGKCYKPVGVKPQITDVGKLRGNTLSDLFFLEPPRTFNDLKYRAETYALKINIFYEEALNNEQHS